ncbi:PilZ domain-containing protein [Candidatus Omnitrophota bacterium]
MIERRRFMRFDAELKVTYKVSNGAKKGSAVITNVSKDGIRTMLNKQFGRNTEVAFRVCIPNEEKPIVAHAGVMWNKKIDMKESGFSFVTGLRLTKIDGYDKSRILNYVYERWVKTRGKTAGKTPPVFENY